MFNLIKRWFPFFISLTHQMHPNEKRRRKAIPNNTRQTTLAFFQTRQLFRLTVKLLNLPATATRLLCRRDIRLTQVVVNDIIRAPRSRRNPENFHFVAFGKTAYFDAFARLKF